MKKLSAILAALALVVIAVSCADDIFLPEIPSLQGEYSGEYSYTADYTKPNATTVTAPIDRLVFTETQYNMKVFDPPGDEKPLFCSPFGSYTLSDKVELVQSPTGEGCAGTIADESQNPTGDFDLRRPPDSVILTRVNTTAEPFFRMELKLKRNP